MYAWEAIQSSIDYIETHLKEDIKIEDLAQHAHLSLYYYQRLFTKLVKKPVLEYVTYRRLACAKHELKNQDKRITDIAFEFGFQSHESFSRSFKTVYGITPSDYRIGNHVLHDFLKPNLQMNYTIVEESIPLIVDDMVLEIRSEQLTHDQYFTGVTQTDKAEAMNQVGVNTLVTLWDTFLKVKDTIPNLLENAVMIDYFTYGSSNGDIMYFVGGQSTNEKFTNFHQITMKKGFYYVCEFEASDFSYLVNDALYKANSYFFDVWLKNKQIHMSDMESYLVQKYYRYEENPKIEVWIQLKSEH